MEDIMLSITKHRRKYRKLSPGEKYTFTVEDREILDAGEIQNIKNWLSKINSGTSYSMNDYKPDVARGHIRWLLQYIERIGTEHIKSLEKENAILRKELIKYWKNT